MRLRNMATLRWGADPNHPNADGWMALHHAALNGHDLIAQLLLKKDAHVSACDKFGAQPLFRAAGL